jgi:hypothetical protein
MVEKTRIDGCKKQPENANPPNATDLAKSAEEDKDKGLFIISSRTDLNQSLNGTVSFMESLKASHVN